MAYQVDKFNGTFLTSVEDGTIDTTTDLRFVGKNYAGYGEVQNENFLHLLENFANTTSPPRAVEGQVWYDSGNKKLKFYNGTRFKTTSGAETSVSAPSGLSAGEFWWDTSAKQLYAWSGTEFVLIGPEASPDLGSSGVTAQVVKDSGNTNHSILKLQAGGTVVGIISQTAFTLNTSVNPIDGFTAIKKGFTLVNTDSNGESGDSFVYWGSASDALKLGGVPANDYLQKGNISFDPETEIKFPDSGFNVGDDNDLRVWVDGDELYIESELGNPIRFIIKDSGVTRKFIGQVTTTGILPGQSATYTLGASGNVWSEIHGTSVIGNLTGNVTGNTTGSHKGSVLADDNQVMIDSGTKEIGYTGATIRGTLFGNVSGNVTGTASNASALNSISPSISVPVSGTSIPIRDASGDIYANQFVGIADRSDTLLSNGDYRTAEITAANNSIAARTATGDIAANLFQGTATAARYADLAEKYLTDKDYEAGTVMMIGGITEATATTEGSKAIGVISQRPAFMMNSELAGGQYIALKGRTIVKVIGSVAKGDRLIPTDNGAAKVSEAHPDVFAVAIGSSAEEGEKFIEAVIL